MINNFNILTLIDYFSPQAFSSNFLIIPTPIEMF